MSVQNYWDAYDQEVSEQGSLGIIGLVKVDNTWKTFPSGIDQEHTFFPTVPCNESSPDSVKQQDKKAMLAAKAFGKDNGAERNPSKGICIRVYRNEAVTRGKPASWKADRFFFNASWTSAGEKVKQSVRDSGIQSLPWEGWARVGFFDDPFFVDQGEAGKSESDGEGGYRYPQVAYVVEMFASADVAREAMGDVTADSGDSEVSVAGDTDTPAGWEAGAWKSVLSEIWAAKEAGSTNVELAKLYNVDMPTLIKSLAAFIPM